MVIYKSSIYAKLIDILVSLPNLLSKSNLEVHKRYRLDK
jgi:hypothetical protein